MANKKLVVDANIARSAGDTTSAPHSTHCREVLLAIFSKGYFLVMTEKMEAEWVKHQSNFSLLWRANMAKKNRIFFVSASEFQALHRLITNLAPRVINQKAVLKDFHVFASALASDRLIISDDLALRKHLVKLTGHHPPVGKLIWGSPLEEQDQCAVWVSAGAKQEGARHLENLDA